MRRSRAHLFAVTAGLALAIAAVLVVQATTGLGGESAAAWSGTWLAPTAEALAAAAAFALAGGGRSRLLLPVALACGAAGGLVYAVLYRHDLDPPVPSLADPLYGAVYVLLVAALATRARRPARGLASGLWLDGVIAALLVGGVWALLVIDSLRENVGHLGAVQLATAVAYPVADVVLLALLAGTLALDGWRIDRGHLLLGGGIVLYALADTAWSLELVVGGDSSGGLFAAAWIVAFVVWAAASGQRRRAAPAGDPGPVAALLPAAFGLGAVVLLVGSSLGHADELPLGLAAAATLLTLLRFALTSVDNARLLARTRSEALTDALTSLPNRRHLEADIADGSRPDRVLVLFDLDGFKGYNDAFGHPAGDALLRDVAVALAGTVGRDGTAYRLGGDEFCVVMDAGEEPPVELGSRLALAMARATRGMLVTASYGTARLAAGVTDATVAFREADRELYRHKQRVDRVPPPARRLRAPGASERRERRRLS